MSPALFLFLITYVEYNLTEIRKLTTLCDNQDYVDQIIDFCQHLELNETLYKVTNYTTLRVLSLIIPSKTIF